MSPPLFVFIKTRLPSKIISKTVYSKKSISFASLPFINKVLMELCERSNLISLPKRDNSAFVSFPLVSYTRRTVPFLHLCIFNAVRETFSSLTDSFQEAYRRGRFLLSRQAGKPAPLHFFPHRQMKRRGIFCN